MKTLYLTDMDGTLLNNEGIISPKSREIINSLASSGMLFSVATARSIISAKQLLDGVNITAPAVLQSGVVIYDFQKGKTLKCFGLDENAFYRAAEVFTKHGKSPFVSFFNGQTENYEITFTDLKLKEHVKFYETRRKNSGLNIHRTEEYRIPKGFTPVFISLCDCREDLEAIKNELEAIDGVGCSFYKDTYTPLWFLEVFSKRASKANGLLIVKELVRADKAVVFGDNLNDMTMFEAADYTCAVKNAVDELKNAADTVIKSNEDDAVAKYLAENFVI